MFKKLEKWLNDYEEEMFNDLMGLKKAVAYARPLIREQKQNGKQCVYELPDLKEKFRGYGSWELPERYELRFEVSSIWDKDQRQWVDKDSYYLDALINIDGKDYKETVMYNTAHYTIEPIKRSALNQYVLEKGHTPSDIDLIDGRSDEWISTFCAKEKEAKRKYIEAKVEKICGKDVEEVEGENIGDLYVRGSNGKTAHIWEVQAGGYNIQRLHIRILVKEVK